MVTVYSEDHAFQRGQFELMDGRFTPCVETPERAEIILERVKEVGLGEVVAPGAFGLAPLLKVHDPAYLAFLETAFDDWRAAHGDRDALPLAWPVRGSRRLPESIDGRLGFYAFDAATPLTAGTWRAAKAAVDVALTAQSLVTSGEGSAFALCRPPGHHAAYDLYGGYCFLNNAAVAARALAGADVRVAVLDLDYHHGNGTQAIFYDRPDVLFVSLHADPAHDYPFFLGYADERGEGAGEGFNLNLPLPLGTDWPRYDEALELALKRITAYAPDVLVVSLGVDTYEADPITQFRLRAEDFLRLGERLASLRLPTLFVMEGGYAVEGLGVNVVNVLTGFEEA